MAFSENWRKRHACERCRKHKVRCEYLDPTSQRCIRCSRTNSECIVIERTPKKQNSAGFSAPKNVKTPEEEKHGDDSFSKLVRAVHDEIYDFEEIGKFYAVFLESDTELPICEPPKTLCELDKTYPCTALALVTCVSLSTTTKNAAERFKLVEPLMSTGLDDNQSLSFDSHSALILLYQYLLPYAGKGLLRLNILHGSMMALQQRVRFGTNVHKLYGPIRETPSNSQVIRLYQQTGKVLMTYSFEQNFEAISPVASLYMPIESLVLLENQPLSMLTTFSEYQSATKMIQQTASVQDAMNICALGVEKFDGIHTGQVGIFVLVARLKLIVYAMNWTVQSLGADSLDAYIGLVISAVDKSVEYLKMLSASSLTCTPTPVSWCYVASTLLSTLWSLRLYCFAVNMDYDVPINDFNDLISGWWRELVATTFTGRAGFVAQMAAMDLLRFQFGYLNELTSRVEGSGGMETFYVYLMGDNPLIPVYQEAMTACDLRELIRFDNMMESRSLGTRSLTPSTHEEFMDIFTHIVRAGPIT